MSKRINFEYFFARRIAFQPQRKASGLVIRLSIISIALAVATIEIALSFVQGFEVEIQKKVIGFGSHVQIGNYYRELDTELVPLPKNEPSLDMVRDLSYVRSVSAYVEKWSVFKSDGGWDGVWLKGVDSTYDWTFFGSVLKEGRLPDFRHVEGRESLEVLISRKQARRLDVKVGDRPLLLFLPEPVKRRRITVVGIYETGMEEFDNNIVVCDGLLIQRVLRWETDQVTGFEVNLDLERIEACGWYIDNQWPFAHRDCEEPMRWAASRIDEYIPFNFGAISITDLYPEIFDWLTLQHQNVWVILFLMIIVAIINMTSVVLILIIERTRTIGILKALGLPSPRIRSMFVWYAFFLILIGVVAGNILGLGLLATQDAFGWLRVNQEDYFIEVVPVAWVWGKFFLVNVIVVGICTAFMVIPSMVINRVQPVKAIRFE
ncbi:MAG: ABC transporter permease [Bacteroidia bacterium]